MRSENGNTHYKQMAAKPFKDRTPEELYRTIEFAGSTMHDKALAKAELARRERWDRMKLVAAGALLGVLFTTVVGLITDRLH